jgi:hypothetical protein
VDRSEPPPSEAAGERLLLRHTVATLAYRGGKALRGIPEGFADFKPSPTTRTPLEILGHLGDLMDWAVSIAEGAQRWVPVMPVTWEEGVARFYANIASVDAYLASDKPLASPAGQLFQGALADAFTHVGQINLLRRMAGGPVKGENYFRADIVVGRIGPEQTPPRREFD